jgi:hypothetical protein
MKDQNNGATKTRKFSCGKENFELRNTTYGGWNNAYTLSKGNCRRASDKKYEAKDYAKLTGIADM